ncbi:MAG: glycosyltransferase [Rhodobacteraceae bacterium]|nr:glycosyltransferase [Paracoccaceae bacterium]
MSISSLFRRDYLHKFVSVLRRDGAREALRRAAYYAGVIAFGRGRSVFGEAGHVSHHYAAFWRTLVTEDAFFISRKPAEDRKSRRIALIGDLNLPQCRRYRVEQLKELWALSGVELDFSHFEDVPHATDLLQTATHAIFYRVPQCPIVSAYFYEAHRLGVPVMYDIDDPLFSVSAYGTYGNAEAFGEGMRDHFISLAPLYASAMNACDIVTVSTPALRNHAKLFCNRPVYLRRNFADRDSLEHGRMALERIGTEGRERRPFTVAFASGSQGHEVDLATMLPELVRFLLAAPDRRLLVLGHFDIERLPQEIAQRTETRPFLGYDAYLDALASADCAILPLGDDLFNRCKSGVRVIDAASVGIPSIVSNIGDAPTLIEPGKTGIVAGPGQWLEALETLAADRKATAEMGRAARRALEESWSARMAPPIIDPEVRDWVLR